MTAASANRPRRIGVAADHGGYALKEQMAAMLRDAGYTVIDFGDGQPTADDDYPDFVVPMARAVVRGEIDRGVAICGSGVGACVVGQALAWELLTTFLAARFSGAERHRRRLAKVSELERQQVRS